MYLRLKLLNDFAVLFCLLIDLLSIGFRLIDFEEETNFVIPEDYFVAIFDKLFPRENDISFFLEVYEPETDGEKIYQQAKKDGKIIVEFEAQIQQ